MALQVGFNMLDLLQVLGLLSVITTFYVAAVGIILGLITMCILLVLRAFKLF